jgi:hypothetical protein
VVVVIEMVVVIELVVLEVESGGSIVVSSGAKEPMIPITRSPATDQPISLFRYSLVFGPRAHNKNGVARPQVQRETNAIPKALKKIGFFGGFNQVSFLKGNNYSY